MRIKWRPSAYIKDFMGSLIALSTGFIDLIAGHFAVQILGLIGLIPWAIIVFPPLLSGRGAISGVNSGNITTMLHLGSIKPSLRNNTRIFYVLLSSVIITSFIVALSLFGALLVMLIVLSYDFDILMLLSVTILSFVISVSVSIFVTILFASISFKFGVDPDIVTYPFVSSINDVIITLIYFSLLKFYLSKAFRCLMDILLIATIVMILILVYIYYDDPSFRKTVKEATSAGLVAISIAIFSGYALDSFQHTLRRYPEILIILPTILTCLGDQGSIYSSRTTTRLYRGVLDPFLGSYFKKENILDIFLISVAGLIMFTIYGIIGIIMSQAYSRIIVFIFVLYTISLIGVFVVSFAGFLISTGSYRFNLNPDNFAIPLVTTLTDLVFTVITVSITSFYYSVFLSV